METDCNAEKHALDFGYTQSKWVAEQLALGARARGLDVRIYRPALISVSTSGIGDANDVFLGTLALAWPDRPKDAEYLGNPAFHRLFLSPRRLKPKLIVKGSGIDWLAVSAEWEAEGLKLSKADLERLARAGCNRPMKPWRTWAWRVCFPWPRRSDSNTWPISMMRNCSASLIRPRRRPCGNVCVISRACPRLNCRNH